MTKTIFSAIIELLNKTLTTLTGTEAKDDGTLVEMTDYSDLWGVKTYKESDYWFMKIGLPCPTFLYLELH